MLTTMRIPALSRAWKVVDPARSRPPQVFVVRIMTITTPVRWKNVWLRFMGLPGFWASEAVYSGTGQPHPATSSMSG